jgi:hypothetical protein
MANELTPEKTEALKKRAEAYFKKVGIDPTKKPENAPVAPTMPKILSESNSGDGITTEVAVIQVYSILVYTYCQVNMPGYEFSGHTGGLGAGASENAGVIYYADKAKLLKTTDFGVFYAAHTGGVIHVTWGTHGNATAAGVGEGFGAFGGSGSWDHS